MAVLVVMDGRDGIGFEMFVVTVVVIVGLVME